MFSFLLRLGDYVNQTQGGKHFILDGLSHALYWASPLVEMSFLVPTIRSYKLANRSRARSSPRESFEMRRKFLKIVLLLIKKSFGDARIKTSKQIF